MLDSMQEMRERIRNANRPEKPKYLLVEDELYDALYEKMQERMLDFGQLPSRDDQFFFKGCILIRDSSLQDLRK